MFSFKFFSRKANKPSTAAAAPTPTHTNEKALPMINEKALPPPPSYETVVINVPPAYAPTALFPTRDAAGRPVMATRARRSIRAPANLDMTASSQLLPPVRAISRCVVVTSKPDVAGFTITHDLGAVQATAATLGEVKLLLRLQGEQRKAYAVTDVVVTSSGGEKATLSAVGRAVRLRKA